MSKKSDNSGSQEDSIASFEEPPDDPTVELVDRPGKKKISRAIKSQFKDYCGHSSIHGTQYLGEDKRHWIERVFWSILLCFALFMCLEQIWYLYQKSLESPVIISFSEQLTPVSEIHFPSVTICPKTKSLSRHLRYSDILIRLKNLKPGEELDPPLTLEQNRSFYALQHLAYHKARVGNHINIYEPPNNNIQQALNDVAPQLEDTISECLFRGCAECLNFFEKIVTESGICFNFNAAQTVFGNTFNLEELKHEITITYGLTCLGNNYVEELIEQVDDMDDTEFDNIFENIYPFKGSGSGQKHGLSLVLQGYEDDWDFLFMGPNSGFDVQIHVPNDVPQMEKSFFRVPFDHDVFVSVHPGKIETTKTLRRYKPDERQCYFEGEKELKYYNYTQNNCEVECLRNFISKTCNCSPFWITTKNTCRTKDLECFENALKSYIQHREYIDECKCKPACTSVNYATDISLSPLYMNEYLMAINETVKPRMHTSRLMIFFAHDSFQGSKRAELYGQSEFISNCGGILGLFMGVSTLSLIEILYFCTLRIIGNRLKRRKEKKGDENAQEKLKE